MGARLQQRRPVEWQGELRSRLPAANAESRHGLLEILRSNRLACGLELCCRSRVLMITRLPQGG
jgi:hypothetical protein